jgi:hypothetical protein
MSGSASIQRVRKSFREGPLLKRLFWYPGDQFHDTPGGIRLDSKGNLALVWSPDWLHIVCDLALTLQNLLKNDRVCLDAARP